MMRNISRLIKVIGKALEVAADFILAITTLRKARQV